jgi:hypothetical protein
MDIDVDGVCQVAPSNQHIMCALNLTLGEQYILAMLKPIICRMWVYKCMHKLTKMGGRSALYFWRWRAFDNHSMASSAHVHAYFIGISLFAWGMSKRHGNECNTFNLHYRFCDTQSSYYLRLHFYYLFVIKTFPHFLWAWILKTFIYMHGILEGGLCLENEQNIMRINQSEILLHFHQFIVGWNKN